jgi:hypothetical protein
VLHRYVCVGIALLDLGGTARAGKQLETVVVQIFSARDDQIIYQQGRLASSGGTKHSINKATVKVVKVGDATNPPALSELKAPLKGSQSSLDGLKNAISLSKNKRVNAVVVFDAGKVIEIGYVDATNGAIKGKDVGGKITSVSQDRVGITVGGKPQTYKVDGKTKVTKLALGEKNKSAALPSTIKDLQDAITASGGGVSGTVTLLEGGETAGVIRYLGQESTDPKFKSGK